MSPDRHEAESGSRLGAGLAAWVEDLRAGARVPTDTALGRKWGVSSRTIRRHMKKLEARGLVVRVQGSGTFRTPLPRQNAPTVTPLSGSSRDRLTSHLADAIARGEIQRGDPLPLAKYLKLQYGVSGKTILRAYQRLEQQGLAHRIGRRFHAGTLLPAVHPLRHRNVWLIVPERDHFDQVFEGDLMAPAYVAFERTLRTLGLTLRYETWDNLPRLLHGRSGDECLAAGVVVWRLEGDEYPRVEKAFASLVTRVPAPRTSLLLDAVSMGPIRRAPRHVDIISRGNIMTTQARAVADFVQQRGRYPAALVYSAESIRERGARWFLRFQKVAFELFHRSGEPVISYIVDPQKRISRSWIAETILTNQEWYFDYLAEKLGQPRIRSTAFVEESLLLVNDFDEVVRRTGPASLLVFPIDETARTALTRFRESGIEVPRDVWLLTLDGQAKNFPLGLSACAPDWDTIGYLMAHAILGDIPLKRTRRGFLRVPSPVVERLTTGRAGDAGGS